MSRHGHDHAHGHGHGDDHGHDHDAPPARTVARALVLIGGFMFVEVVGGLLTDSLTLLADAGHMFLDASALGFAFVALKLSERSSDERLSYGYHRYQVLASFLNGLLLAALVVWILIEAYGRLREPAQMHALPALLIAATGLVVNLIAWRWLHAGADNAAVQSAMLHVLGDLLGSGAAILAALVVWLTGWGYADPLLAVVIAAILARGAWQLLRDAGHILLEGVPRGLDLEHIRGTLTAAVPAVVDIHHIHAWALTAEKPLVTLHATVLPEADLSTVMRALKAELLHEFGIDHSTIQVEHDVCPDDSAPAPTTVA